MDYGHPLRFGTFITPLNAPAAAPVELAVLSERLGFDYVTFQDHPYQPAFHDTWTLLTWVAARTERIGISGNVLNLPLRPPAVLARSAASLDLLSGGRLSLGLGAGGFHDAIAAMGGPRLTIGESVTALDEALDVIRGIWDASDRRPLRAGGAHHAVDGAKRGPAPAHPVPIWLGALKPRMLRLIGRKADGWLPSLAYLQPGGLASGNRIIDDAATAAGRDPGAITRLLNLPPNVPAEELARLALEDGVSVFIVTGDDPNLLRRYAGEVVPEVRELVAAERRVSAGAATGTVSRAAGGAPIGDPPASLRPLRPGDAGYDRYRSGYLRGGAPALVLRPRTPAEVGEALRFAARHRDAPLGILSGGHGISGRSINRQGIVLDVSAFDTVELLDAATGRVRVGPGARWADVARALTPHGLAVTSGDYGGVGVGGLATAGGIGWFAREHGLTIDLMRSVDVVLADGRLVTASAEENPDLFWAMRGAGANFGVAVAFEFEAQRVGDVGFAQLVFDASDTAGFLERWGRTVEEADRAVSGEVILGGGTADGRYAQVMLVVNSPDPDTILGHLQPFAEVAPLLQQEVTVRSYLQVIDAFPSDGAQQGRGEPLSHSGLVRSLDTDFSRDAAALLDTGASSFFAIRAVGGAVADVPAEATAYSGRSAGFSVVALGSRFSALDEEWRRLLPHFDGMYLSFETDQGPDVVARAFAHAHLERLRELKRRYDPEGLLRDNFFIDPGEAESVAEAAA